VKLPAWRQSHLFDILGGVLWVGGFILITKIVGAAKEMAVAARFGTDSSVDAYLLVLRIYELPVGVWASSLTTILVPLIFSMRRAAPEELEAFLRELAAVTLVAGAVIGAVLAFGLGILLEHTGFGAPPEVVDIATGMVMPLALIVPLGALLNVSFARMVAAGRRGVSLVEALPAAVLLVALLASAGNDPRLLTWGTVAGYAAELCVLLLYQRRTGAPQRFRISLRSGVWRRFAWSLSIVFAADFLLGVTTVIDQLMVAPLSSGAVATMGYANRLLVLLIAIGGTALTRIMLPLLAEAHSSGADEALMVARRWAWIFFGLGVAALVAGWVAAPLMVELIFERGAFTPADTMAVTEIFRFGLLQLPFYFSSIVFSQLWAARGYYQVFFFANAAKLAVKLVANFALIAPFGINGIMIATALMYASSLGISVYLVRRFR
jgi:peptidoglycan biosynthesis protein MviN/MurJ (putative lipid II flippase)